MEEIARHQIAPATNSYINKNIIRGIGAFFLAAIGGALIYTFVQVIRFGQLYLHPPPYFAMTGHGKTGWTHFNWGRIFNSAPMSMSSSWSTWYWG